MISFVIPVYDRAPYLKAQLGALEYQTDQDFEVILSDDGSTGEQAEQNIAAASVFGHQYLWNPRGETFWLTRTANAGFKRAKGEWFVLLTVGVIPASWFVAEVKKLDRGNVYPATTPDNVPFIARISREQLAEWDDKPWIDARWMDCNDPASKVMWNGDGAGTDRRRILFAWNPALAIHRDDFFPLREDYQGWGCDDVAYAATAVRRGLKIAYRKELRVYHMSHPPTPNKEHEASANRGKLETEFPELFKPYDVGGFRFDLD